MDPASSPTPHAYGIAVYDFGAVETVNPHRQPSDESPSQPSNQLGPSTSQRRKGKARVRFSLEGDSPENTEQRPVPNTLSAPTTPQSFLTRIGKNVPEGAEPSEEEHGEKHKENLRPSSAKKGGPASTMGTGIDSPKGVLKKSSIFRPLASVFSKKLPMEGGNIPMVKLKKKHAEQVNGPQGDDEYPEEGGLGQSRIEAERLVRLHSRNGDSSEHHGDHEDELPPEDNSRPATPLAERDPDDYVSRPSRYPGGILGLLIQQPYPDARVRTESMPSGNQAQPRRGEDDTGTAQSSPGAASGNTSGHATPSPKSPRWYNRSADHSTTSITGLLESLALVSTPAGNKHRAQSRLESTTEGKSEAALNRTSSSRPEGEVRMDVHIADIVVRQGLMVKLCRAFIAYGAPTHRLEEYMRMTARVLQIDGQFLYIPGCMIISIRDPDTYTTDVRMVRNSQGVDLGKLLETYEIYKDLIQERVSVAKAYRQLEQVMGRGPKFSTTILVVVYGLASATVAPFAFQARLIDLPVAFLLGVVLALLRLVVAPKSELYSNVFELSAVVLTSFLARMFGSVGGGQMFCFSALAQSAIALILPGYVVLCGSLELQSKNIVAGSVRMVYAIIYSLFLGFGVTIGTALYGVLNVHATSATTCKHQLDAHYGFLFVPCFTLCLIIIHQAKWKQAGVMLFLAFAGYTVNFFSSEAFPAHAQISGTLGALTVGLLGNLWSRFRHGVAAAALLPAIFVLLPSGLAASGSLVSGVRSADQLINTANHTIAPWEANKTALTSGDDPSPLDSVVVNVGMSMIQVTIGITVGLFLSALVVYPFGKRKSGLFSF